MSTPARRNPSTSVGKLLGTGQRCRAGRVAVLAEQPDCLPDLAEALQAQPLGLDEGSNRLGRVLLDGQPSTGHVQLRDRECMPDHVMELARDPVALLDPGPVCQPGLRRRVARR